MENQQKMKSSMSRSYEYSVPKVSIDGQSHADLLLIAILCGATLAFIILIILTSLIKHKKKPDTEKMEGNFTLAPSPSDSGISTSSSQKSNLMFRYFGKSLSSFDIENISTIEKQNPCSKASYQIDTEDNGQKQFYRQNIVAALNLNSIEVERSDSCNQKYLQTIAC